MDERTLLELWEEGAGLSPGPRALALARHVEAGLDEAPVGARDAALLRLRQAAFGPRLPVEARCPSCRESVELALAIPDLLPAAPPGAAGSFEMAGRHWAFRAPTALDLAELLDPRQLARRCVPDAGPAELDDPSFQEALSAAILRVDPLAEIELEIACACGASWSAVLDVVGYVWTEIDRSARGTLRTVALLANRYGWSEQDILRMSHARRALYLAEGTA